MRTVTEWIGKTDDAAIPPHVKLRIWDREKGVCYLSGRKIRAGEPYDFEHKVALCNGGEHRESNIFLALREKHKEKTAEDRAEKADIDAKRKKHLLPKEPSWAFRKPPGYKHRWGRSV
jgi:5-methylcytosine-specific restriction endonuclease McrA